MGSIAYLSVSVWQNSINQAIRQNKTMHFTVTKRDQTSVFALQLHKKTLRIFTRHECAFALCHQVLVCNVCHFSEMSRARPSFVTWRWFSKSQSEVWLRRTPIPFIRARVHAFATVRRKPQAEGEGLPDTNET